jgi:tRNA (cmo5U34)-methyltransferase
MSKALLPLIDERTGTILALDNDDSMVKTYQHNIIHNRIGVLQSKAEDYEYDEFDVAIVFLTAMFLPVEKQSNLIDKLYGKLKTGGAIIIVDKVCEEDGYFSTVMKRLTMYWKLKNGAHPEDIINKELSLSGVQRPIDSDLLRIFGAKQFFQLGEFKGWVIEK